MKYKVSNLIERFLLHKELAENRSKVTLEGYRGYLNRFMKWSNDTDVSLITPDDILKYHIHVAKRKDRNGKPLSDKSRREYFVALRSFFKYLNKNDIPALLAEKIDIPRAHSPLIVHLTRKEIDNMFDVVSGNDLISLRNKALLEVLYCTGTRISEILNVDTDQIDLEMGDFSVMGKGRKPRVVFLSERATKAVLQYLEARNDDFRPLFIDHSTNASARKTGARLSRRSVSVMVRQVAKKAGITKKVTPHVFRHSIATHMLQGGVDIRTVQRFLGHASIRSTEIYTHVTDYHLKKTISQFHNNQNLIP